MASTSDIVSKASDPKINADNKPNHEGLLNKSESSIAINQLSENQMVVIPAGKDLEILCDVPKGVKIQVMHGNLIIHGSVHTGVQIIVHRIPMIKVVNKAGSFTAAYALRDVDDKLVFYDFKFSGNVEMSGGATMTGSTRLVAGKVTVGKEVVTGPFLDNHIIIKGNVLIKGTILDNVEIRADGHVFVQGQRMYVLKPDEKIYPELRHVIDFQEYPYVNRWLLNKLSQANKLQGWMNCTAKKGNISYVHTLLSLKGQVNERSDLDETTLETAMNNGHYDIAEFLLDAKADAEIQKSELLAARQRKILPPTRPSLQFLNRENTIEEAFDVAPLRLLLLTLTPSDPRMIDIWKYYIRRGLKPDTNVGFETALEWAQKNENTTIVKMLLNPAETIKHVSITNTTDSGDTKTTSEIAQTSSLDNFYFQQFFESNFDKLIKVANPGKNEVEALNDLLSMGFIKGVSTSMSHPMLLAAEKGKLAYVRVFVEYGIDVNLKNTFQGSALECALKNGHIDCAAVFIDNGADIKPKNKRDESILCFARQGKCEAEFIKILKDRNLLDVVMGANNSPNDANEVHKAMTIEHKLDQEVLTQHNNSFLRFSGTLINLKGRNLVELPSVIRVLEQCTLKKDNSVLPSPELALRRAAAAGKLEIIQTLLDCIKDIDINQPGPDSGKTAIMIAKEFNQPGVIELLEKHRAKLEMSKTDKDLPTSAHTR